jgi:hypothetical protein
MSNIKPFNVHIFNAYKRAFILRYSKSEETSLKPTLLTTQSRDIRDLKKKLKPSSSLSS